MPIQQFEQMHNLGRQYSENVLKLKPTPPPPLFAQLLTLSGGGRRGGKYAAGIASYREQCTQACLSVFFSQSYIGYRGNYITRPNSTCCPSKKLDSPKNYTRAPPTQTQHICSTTQPPPQQQNIQQTKCGLSAYCPLLLSFRPHLPCFPKQHYPQMGLVV